MRWPVLLPIMLTFTADAAWADRMDCLQNQDLGRTIQGCFEIIENSKREGRENQIAAYNNRGNAYYARGNLDGALADYTKAILINPKYAQTYYNRANVYRAKGDLERAIADHTKAIKLDPKYAGAYVNR